MPSSDVAPPLQQTVEGKQMDISYYCYFTEIHADTTYGFQPGPSSLSAYLEIRQCPARSALSMKSYEIFSPQEETLERL
ncbi:hypothetical protein Agabi119p4_1590 [Agaricus bisporus var. burnettii]|uniref:Uncharacterized protein n=1 Tax=Agaricus bisporus var. burnettii TaxID=192524 RepID=A0A8H7F7S3_AGABI|nr:hypothetical protein Agabi119p4_1590 [Agaricus bisporus var. burnettii]